MPESRNHDRSKWAQRVLLDELRDQAERLGVASADDLSRDELVEALRTRRTEPSRDPYAAHPRPAP